MTPREQGFLLLRSSLGDPERKPLTAGEYRTLVQRARTMERPQENREMTQEDLKALGYDRAAGERILRLLSQQELLEAYEKAARRKGCTAITWITEQYPERLLNGLGLDAPACFWGKGDWEILKYPAISLVGSRVLRPENRSFAEAVGYEAAIHGFTLVSGNARGADQAAQDACLAAGGRVVSILPDELTKYSPHRNQLLLSEDGFADPFSTRRALRRNHSIHALGQIAFVAQADCGKGGTWDGTRKNLHYGWSDVICFRDGSESSREFAAMGARLIDREDIGGILDEQKGR